MTERSVESVAGAAAAAVPPLPRWVWFVPLAIVVLGGAIAWVASGSAAAHPDFATWETLTPAARRALGNLRTPGPLHWYVVPLLALVMYVYAVEVERRDYSRVLAGLALFGADWFNEVANGLVLYFTRRAAVWTTPADSAFVILPGWNIEIAFMFAIAGIVFVKLLPADRARRVFGLPNRWFWAVAMSVFAVFVEVLLNRAGVLVWEWPWWNWPNVGLIVVFGYLSFFVVAFWVHDMQGLARKAAVVAILYAFDLALTLVFVIGLGWM